jgi:hypothetical protein
MTDAVNTAEHTVFLSVDTHMFYILYISFILFYVFLPFYVTSVQDIKTYNITLRCKRGKFFPSCEFLNSCFVRPDDGFISRNLVAK